MNSRPIFLSFILSQSLALCLDVGTPMAASSEGVKSSEWQVSDLMALMAQVSSSHETFTEKKYMDVLAEPLVLSGHLSYVRPDHIERHVRSPYEERLLVDGDRLTLETPDGQKQITLHKYPVIWGFVESIRATLMGDEATLRGVYEIKLDGNRRQWTLTLKPRDRRLAEHVTAIKISGTGNRILRVETQEADGDRSVMTINENPA